MSKRIISVFVFVGLAVLAIGAVSSALDAADPNFSDCMCFNEVAAETVCESLCQAATGTHCIQTVPTNGWCENYQLNNNCAFNFWAYCAGGNQYRRTVTQTNCMDCSKEH